MSEQPAIIVRRTGGMRHTRTLSTGAKGTDRHETSASVNSKKATNKQPNKKIILKLRRRNQPDSEPEGHGRKPSFRLREVRLAPNASSTTSSTVMKLPGSLKTTHREGSLTSRKTDDVESQPIHTEVVRPAGTSEISSSRSNRRSPHQLNFFERPKIAHILKHKFMMRAAGCQQDDQWNNYWLGIEKKISAIERKQDESVLLGHSCINLFPQM